MHPVQAGGNPPPKGELASAIDTSFGSFEAMKEQFNARTKTLFGSGWVWLYLDVAAAGGAAPSLKIQSSPNQDSPAMDGRKVILGLDLWEHAYYLQYKNVRADYVKAWWTVVDWESVASQLQAAKRHKTVAQAAPVAAVAAPPPPLIRV